MCNDIHAPGFYVHITSDECFFAVGCGHPDADTLSSIRNLIVVKPEQWLAARDDKKFNTYWDMSGVSLPHAARGYDFNNPLFKGIKRKYFISPSALSITEVSGRGQAKLAGNRAFYEVTVYRGWRSILINNQINMTH